MLHLVTNSISFVYRQSFGYDCHKRSNLLLVDEDTLIYSAGNVLVLLKISTREHVYLRTLGGGGIGAITVNIYKL